MSEPETTYTTKIYPALERLRGYSRRLTRTEADAEELWAATAEKAWRYVDTFEPESNARAWVSTIMRNLACNMAKSAYARRETSMDANDMSWWKELSCDFEAESMIDEKREVGQRSAVLREAIEALPPTWRDATEQALDGRSHQEIAEAQGTTKGTVDSRTYRSRNRIREYVSRRMAA